MPQPAHEAIFVCAAINVFGYFIAFLTRLIAEGPPPLQSIASKGRSLETRLYVLSEDSHFEVRGKDRITIRS
jgi:hypothetical protein